MRQKLGDHPLTAGNDASRVKRKKYMSKLDSMFAATQLRDLRREANAKNIRLPKNLTAIKSGTGSWYLVEGDNGFSREVSACSALDARVKALEWAISEAEKKTLSPLIRGTRMALGFPV
jgi:hypothetical protein